MSGTRLVQFFMLATCFVIISLNMGAVEAGDACPEENTDYYLNDIKHFQGVSDWKECQGRCQADGGCKFWTYREDTNCWLKDSKAGKRSDGGATSGPKTPCNDCPSLEENTEYIANPANRIVNLYDVPSWQECQNACQNNWDCNNWTYNQDKSCSLLKFEGAKRDNHGATSGKKYC